MSIISDIDGNIYTTVIIGTQEWMVQDLKTTKLNDGTPIPNVTGNSEWTALTTLGYCWYDNNINYKATYGALYNWYAVNSGKLAPIGWHVPTSSEWIALAISLGGTSIAGGKLKQIGTVHWESPNTGATNKIGFNAIGIGARDIAPFGTFYDRNRVGRWWTTTSYSTNMAYYTCMGSWFADLYFARESRCFGFGVRCVRNINSIRKPKYWVEKTISTKSDGSILEINKQQLQMLDS